MSRPPLTPEQQAEYDRLVNEGVRFVEDLLDGKAELRGDLGRAADEMILQGSRLGSMTDAQLRALGRQGLGRLLLVGGRR